MCGGFACSKSSLTLLNVLYIVVGFILIGVATYAKAVSGVSLPIIGGIVACGVFLLLIAVMGLIGAIKHHQVLLFFYMVVLFILFIIQFSIACACLAVDDSTQMALAETGWNNFNGNTRQDIQNSYNCCGFDSPTYNSTESPCPKSCDQECEPCSMKMASWINYAFRTSGGIGLFFSFTEFLGVWLTVRYRNQKDPRGHPGAFL